VQEAGIRERALIWLLRIGAVLTITAFPAALLPADTMADWHARLGLGVFPDAPITGYMARSLSLFYGFHGVLTLIVSTDVRRYRPLVGFLGWMLLALGTSLLFIDLHSGMPPLWTATEAPPTLLFGALILYLRRSVPVD
jgi:hypothetical protein